MQGIDVSSHNPPQDWHDLRAHGLAFSGVRLTHGTSLDVAAEAHLTAAHVAGVPLLLGYHYLTDADPAAQARTFLDRVGALEPIVGELALAVDLEDLPGHPPWPREAYEQTARAFVAAVRAEMRRPVGVYISPAFAAELALSGWFAECPLWLARWAATPGKTPQPWGEITIWQNRVDSVDHDIVESVEAFRDAFGLGKWHAPLEAWGNVVRISDAVRRGEGG